MATDVQKNLVTSNGKYADSFDKGDLALPPAKKYLVGMATHPCSPNTNCPIPLKQNTAQ